MNRFAQRTTVPIENAGLPVFETRAACLKQHLFGSTCAHAHCCLVGRLNSKFSLKYHMNARLKSPECFSGVFFHQFFVFGFAPVQTAP